MTIKLGRNITALKIQSSINRSSSQVEDVMKRLSTGLRVNRPADDPAGLSIAETLKADVVIGNQARRNINDAVSLLQVAESAVSSIRGILSRQGELAEISANGTLSNEQRAALQNEYVSLDREIQRITETTEFNGIKLLEGGKSSAAAQVVGNVPVVGIEFLDISGDGRFGIYIENGGTNLYQIDFETGAETLITNQVAGPIAQSAGGEKVLFGSQSNLTGEDPNLYGQYYIYDRLTGSIEQITNAPALEAPGAAIFYAVAISADGNTVAFTSANRYNPDGTQKSYDNLTTTITTIDLTTGVYSDLGISATVGAPILYLSISADGSNVAFANALDLVGQNADGDEEVFTYQVSDPTGTLKQISNDTGNVGVIGTQVTNEGDVYFGAFGDYAGQNPSGYGQVFGYNAATDTVTQYTSGFSVGALVDTISVDGSKLYFRSAADFLGENPDSRVQLYELDTGSGEVVQRTEYTDTAVLASVAHVSADGRYVLQAFGTELSLVDTRPEAQSLQIQVGKGTGGIIDASLEAVRSSLSGIGGMTIGTQDAALAALDNARKNVEGLSELTGIIGTNQSRLQSAFNTITSVTSELEGARSRIVDADIAKDAAELVRQQILQQFATALLAQANQSSSTVIELISA